MEQGRRASFRREQGEAALCFSSDTPAFKKEFGLTHANDYVFLIESEGQRYLVFIELKNDDIVKAAEQIEETIRALHRKLPRDCVKSTMIAALAVTKGGIPSKSYDRAADILSKLVPLQSKTTQRGDAVEIRPYLNRAKRLDP